MKHYIFLGLNPSYDEPKSRFAFHIPLIDNNSLKKYEESSNKMIKEIINGKIYSIYCVETPNEKWSDLINIHKYFSSIEKPLDSIEEFIYKANDVKLSAKDVSVYLLSLSKMTHLRLQKILYLVYSEFLRRFNKKIFNEKFFAWELGPVNIDVYKLIKSTNESLSTSEITLNFNEKEDNKINMSKEPYSNEHMTIVTYPYFKDLNMLIEEIINKYKDISTRDLVNLLHSKESAWYKTKRNEVITDEIIKESKY